LLELSHDIELTWPVHGVHQRNGGIEGYRATILTRKIGVLEPARNGHHSRHG
jgi:hypothetical protein